VTFAIDADAEEYLADWVARRAPGVAFYSEDRGLVEPAGPSEWVLVVDPIDGTRAGDGRPRSRLRVGGGRAARR
jgi:fructose-1,6-bisphosphatase/inositol monophosphatase family enzyme